MFPSQSSESDSIGIDDERSFEQGNGFGGPFGHDGMRAVSMERIDFFFASQQPRAAPIPEDMDGLPHADCQGHEYGADCHRKDDECDGAELELDGGTGPDCDCPRIELAEIAVEKNSGADEKDRGEQSEHRSRPWFSRAPFSASRAEGPRSVVRPSACPGW